MAELYDRKRKKVDRTAISCDRCRSRKTKCKNPDPGPCDYCKSINADCQTDKGKRKQRPYYYVSEEEYTLLKKIVQHQISREDINLSVLRDVASQLDVIGITTPLAMSETGTIQPAVTESQNIAATPRVEERVVVEEIQNLHGNLGCMMVDSSGEYRYVGPDSGISFNAAVRRLDPDIEARPEEDLIPPMRTATLPPATPSSPANLKSPQKAWLPHKELCRAYISSYFRDVHCLYWLYSSESFHTRLEKTYSDVTSASVSASWLCSLCCIFAIGSMSQSNSHESTKSSEYLAIAKEMVPEICDEADLDSVRALILLALALQAHCFSNNAYLHAGLATRVAFSLGLHVDKYSLSHGVVDKEHARAIWWTLYNFDQEIALRTGKPCSFPEAFFSSSPEFPSEQILNLGPRVPLFYLQASSSLTRLTKRTTQIVYPSSMSGRVVLSQVSELLNSLQDWLEELPPHLLLTDHVASSYRRCISLLHVRYWSVVILATRSFLLCSVLRRDELKDHEKMVKFHELSHICIDAAEKSFRILTEMQRDGTLSSRLPLDFNYVLELIQIFLTADAFSVSERHSDSTRELLQILQSMDNIGWCEKALPEVEGQLNENGLLEQTWDLNTNISDFGLLIGHNDPSFGNYDLYVSTEWFFDSTI